MPSNILEVVEWERVLSSAARLQRILPDAVLVGGTAAALYAGHRLSTDSDHVLLDLRNRFDDVLADLESVAGWKTSRIKRPVQILGSLDGIETGVRQYKNLDPKWHDWRSVRDRFAISRIALDRSQHARFLQKPLHPIDLAPSYSAN